MISALEVYIYIYRAKFPSNKFVVFDPLYLFFRIILVNFELIKFAFKCTLVYIYSCKFLANNALTEVERRLLKDLL